MRRKDCEYSQNELQRIAKDILERVKSLESAISEQLGPVKRQSDELEKYKHVLKYGLEGFKNRIISEYSKKENFDPIKRLLEVLQNFPTLRFPHRKILDYLSKQYDFKKNEFQEVHFSKLVSECRLGKNRAKGYLDELEKMGLVGKRSDGYRVWYKTSWAEC